MKPKAIFFVFFFIISILYIRQLMIINHQQQLIQTQSQLIDVQLELIHLQDFENRYLTGKLIWMANETISVHYINQAPKETGIHYTVEEVNEQR